MGTGGRRSAPGTAFSRVTELESRPLTATSSTPKFLVFARLWWSTANGRKKLTKARPATLTRRIVGDDSRRRGGGASAAWRRGGEGAGLPRGRDSPQRLFSGRFFSPGAGFSGFGGEGGVAEGKGVGCFSISGARRGVRVLAGASMWRCAIGWGRRACAGV